MPAFLLVLLFLKTIATSAAVPPNLGTVLIQDASTVNLSALNALNSSTPPIQATQLTHDNSVANIDASTLNNGAPLTNIAARQATCPSAFNVNYDEDYKVPGTETTIHVRFYQGRDLNITLLGGYIVLVQDELTAYLASHPDGWLRYEDEPYLKTAKGFYMVAKSWLIDGPQGPQHLTYGILLSALMGLFDVCYYGEKPHASYTHIQDSNWGTVGTIVILPARPPLYIADS
ncbi:hypothetical protein MMC28_007127 [Mycoblastus sanguinarius]|nr:hypothetical protein [Mycoblastus sanguinarius]